MKRLLSVVTALSAGLALYGAFPPLNFWPLSFLGIALLIAVLEKRSVWASFGYGLVCGAAFFIPLFDWATTASGTFIAQAALGTAEALFVALTAAIWQGLMRGRWTGENPLGRAVSFSSVFIAGELLRSVAPFGGMPWGLLAFSQVDSPLVRLAPWGSTELVGSAAITLGVLLEWTVRRWHRGELLRGVTSAGMGIALLTATAFIPLSTAAERYITVGYAQGIVPQSSADWDTQAITVTRNLATATEVIAAQSVDLMIWPESASDRDPRTDPEVAAVINGVVKRLDAPLLFGTQRFIADYRYNDVLLWQPSGDVTATYTKQHPIPFGEYMPYRDFFRQLTSAVDQITVDMRPGTEPAVMTVETAEGSVAIATPICFEIAVTQIVSEAVNEGAELIVVPTNNASFGESAESVQQFAMTRFRAVEQGRTAIQVSTVGVSGVVEPNGVVREVTDAWTQAAGTARVGLRTELTFATRYSTPLVYGFFALGAGFTALSWKQLWRSRRSSTSAQKGSRR